MFLKAEINKPFDGFELNIAFETSSRRIGILGRSGAGKSLTLKSLAGIEQPASGYISLNDRVLFDPGARINIKPQKRNIGYLFQNYALFPKMTVAENIAAGLKTDRRATAVIVQEMLDRFDLKGLENRLPEELSGGQKQRVALARIMAYSPELILLDEPFSSLDPYLRKSLLADLISTLSDYDGIVIMVSHDPDELYEFSDELLVIDEGKIAEHGKTKDIFRSPASEAAALLIGGGSHNMNTNEFTHFDDKGNAFMVDVSAKDVTRRTAVAEGRIRISEEAMAAVLGKKLKKGDVFTVAQIAGIMGAKRTPDLIPLCHLINLENVSLTFETDTDDNTITARCEALTSAKTGVEMEALTGVSVALLAVYDMCKAIDRSMSIEDIHLVSKTKE